MTTIYDHDRETPTGDVLDHDRLDVLLERNSSFIAECAAIRERMHAGDALAHKDVVKLFAEDA